MAAAIPAPTPELAELITLLGANNVRELAQTFLLDTPALIADLSDCTPPASGPSRCRLAAHSLKSTASLVGASALSAQAAVLETRLIADGPPPTPAEIDLIRVEFARFRIGLAAFARG